MNWNDLTMAQKNELIQTYIRNGVTSLDDMRSHFNSFATGGPKKQTIFDKYKQLQQENYGNTPIINDVPVMLPNIDVVAEALPKAKATDANIQRYADAIAKGQIKLTQIPDTELRNRVRAKPIVNKIQEDTNKAGIPVIAGTLGVPAGIIGGITAAPHIWRFLNHPVVNTILTVDGVMNAPSRIEEGIQEIKDDKYGKGALDLGLTALDLYGGANLVTRLGRVLNPAYRAKHAYNSIIPVGYHSADKKSTKWLKDLWDNPDIDYKNPKWLQEQHDKYHINLDQYGYTGTGSMLAPDIKHAGKIADEARIDAWAMYNNIPQQYNTYIPNGDGTFSYNMEKLMRDSEGTWHPFISPETLKGVKDAHAPWDFATGAGGGLTGFKDVGTAENPIMRIEDVWDLHPFRNFDNSLNTRLSIYSGKAPTPISRTIDKYLKSDISKKINKKLRDFEVGKLIGGKPFTMRTDIPYYYDNDALIEATKFKESPFTYTDYLGKAIKYKK